MEFAERLELLEERFDDLERVTSNKHDGMLVRHGELLFDLRKEVALLAMEITLVKEKLKFLAEWIDVLDKRIGALEKGIEALEKGIEELEKGIDALEKRIDALEQKIEKLGARVRRVEVLQWVLIALVVPQALIFYLRLLIP